MEPHHRRLLGIFLLLTSADKFGIFGNRFFHLSLAVGSRLMMQINILLSARQKAKRKLI